MRRKPGFTLLELMVVASVIAILLYAVLAIFTGMERQWNAQVSRSEAITAANLGMDRMANEISTAVQYNAFDSSKTNTFNLPASLDALGNYIPDWSGSILSYTPGGRVQFYLAGSDGSSAGNILWRRSTPITNGNVGWINDTTWSLLPSSSTHGYVENVTALTIAAASSPNTVTVSLTISCQEGGTTSAYTLKRDIYMVDHN